ncbi:MAG: HIT domain-containing protein [Elusimicrobia bacterium]|nr:HIT domain-containing protein [Elusimicrobiota bacterium]MBD3411965.1 HIT domain-containing protein [Elusimicrobiota bacterium]
MQNCIFCKLIDRQIPAEIVYESDAVIGFKDINPQAPHHYLIIPKKHIPSIISVTTEHAALVSALVAAGNTIAADKGLVNRGFRLVVNHGPDAGQAVDHVHMHLIGGRKLSWPPG